MHNKGVLGVTRAESAQRRLLRYLQAGRVHPAILLGGPLDNPKLEIAKAIAKFMLCQSKTSDRPFCSECSSCRRIEKELHPDVLIFKNDEETDLKIETIRELCLQMQMQPVEGRQKICIIDECHRMNSASMNAFLKTLEEPGQDRYFLLLSSTPGALLPTLLSRCLVFTFKPDAEASIFSEEDSAKSKALLENLFKTKDIPGLLTSLPEKEDVLGFLRFLQHELRESVLGNPAAPRWQTNDGILKFNAVLELEGRLRSNANYGLMLESLLRKYFLTEEE